MEAAIAGQSSSRNSFNVRFSIPTIRASWTAVGMQPMCRGSGAQEAPEHGRDMRGEVPIGDVPRGGGPGAFLRAEIQRTQKKPEVLELSRGRLRV